jgi:uncharacterized SAM-binding protein YcdF (DUF218 family)
MRRSRRLRLAALLLGLTVAAWLGRAPVLTGIGTALTADDPVAPAAVIVSSLAAVRADALEAAKLYRDGVAPRVVLCRWQAEPLDAEMRRLGVPWLTAHELAAAVLERSGVPAGAIDLLDAEVDGLNSEVAAVAAFARASRPASLLYVTARSHGRRARWLLRRLLPPDIALRVHAPTLDPFRPDSWWRSRESSRELAMEYLRWANTLGLRDLWQGTVPRVAEAPG